jgi:hypothetical protein
LGRRGQRPTGVRIGYRRYPTARCFVPGPAPIWTPTGPESVLSHREQSPSGPPPDGRTATAPAASP